MLLIDALSVLIDSILSSAFIGKIFAHDRIRGMMVNDVSMHVHININITFMWSCIHRYCLYSICRHYHHNMYDIRGLIVVKCVWEMQLHMFYYQISQRSGHLPSIAIVAISFLLTNFLSTK